MLSYDKIQGVRFFILEVLTGWNKKEGSFSRTACLAFCSMVTLCDHFCYGRCQSLRLLLPFERALIHYSMLLGMFRIACRTPRSSSTSCAPPKIASKGYVR